MKTTVLIILTVFMVVFAIKASPQVSSVNPNPKSSSLINDASQTAEVYVSSPGSSAAAHPLQLQGIEGRIYVGVAWPRGSVVLRDGSAIDTYNLRYNFWLDQMQFISGEDTLAFASPQELKMVSFDGHTFVYDNFQCENSIRQGYFEVIVPGKNKLLLKRVVTYRLPDAIIAGDEPETKYLIDEYYFISKPDKPAVKVLCNRKSALAVLNGHKEEMDDYFRITGNKVRGTDDLIKLVTYYNALEEHE
jgi:hypothetical protein